MSEHYCEPFGGHVPCGCEPCCRPWASLCETQAAVLRERVAVLEREKNVVHRALTNAEFQRDQIIRRLAAACGNPALDGEEEFFGELDVRFALERLKRFDEALRAIAVGIHKNWAGALCQQFAAAALAGDGKP